MRLGYITLLILLCITSIYGQPSYREINQKNWEKATRNKDYTEVSEEVNKIEIEQESRAPFEIYSELAQLIAYLIIIIILVLILAFILRKSKLFRNPKIKKLQVKFIQNLDGNPLEYDLDALLKEAIAMQDYRLALRIYYLTVLKQLNLKNTIVWKSNKTNFDYVNETLHLPINALFKKNTTLFETIWYGNTPIEEQYFSLIAPSFIALIEAINTNTN